MHDRVPMKREIIDFYPFLTQPQVEQALDSGTPARREPLEERGLRTMAPPRPRRLLALDQNFPEPILKAMATAASDLFAKNTSSLIGNSGLTGGADGTSGARFPSLVGTRAADRRHAPEAGHRPFRSK